MSETNKETINEYLAKLIEGLAVSTNTGFERIEKNMATKEELAKVQTDLNQVKMDLSGVKTDLSGVKTDLSGVKTDLEQVRVNLESFKSEANERFDKIDIGIKEINENIEGIVADYHPHIMALEEKVFGFSSLA